MPRLYVIGPVTGIPEDNRPAFEAAQKELEAFGYMVEIPHDSIVLGTPHEEAMRISIGQLLSGYYVARSLAATGKEPRSTRPAHVPLYKGVAVLPGWEQSEGARLEKRVAEACGIPCKTVDEWIEKSPLWGFAYPYPAEHGAKGPDIDRLPRYEGQTDGWKLYFVDANRLGGSPRQFPLSAILWSMMYAGARQGWRC